MNYDNRKPLPPGTSFVLTNDKINSYPIVIDKEIGRGGSCLVYEGRHPQTIPGEPSDLKVIVKEFYPHNISDKISRGDDMYLAPASSECEAEFSRRMKLFCKGQANFIMFANENPDKALPPVIFSGEDLGTFYVISTPGAGLTLSEADRSKYTLSDVLEIMTSLADAIGRVHKSSKVYLDCKPGNIYVHENKAYLFDFDTAQIWHNITFASYSEGYSAPEQYFAENSGYINKKQIGYHSDIFSVGAVFYFLLTGNSPGEDDLRRIKQGDFHVKAFSVNDPGGALQDVSFQKELNRILCSLLEPDPAIRMKTYPQQNSIESVENSFIHLRELAENTPYKSGFEKTQKQIDDAKADIEQTIKRNSFNAFIVGSKKRTVGIVLLFLVAAVLFGVFSGIGKKASEKLMHSDDKAIIETDNEADEHLLLRLANDNHRYEVGLEKWRRREYNKAEADIAASVNDIGEITSQSETEVARINNSLGCLYIDMGRYGEAYEYLTDALITFRDTYGEEAMETRAVRFSIAQYDYYSGDVDTAQSSLYEIIDNADREKDRVILTAALHFQALIYDELGNHSKAADALQEVLLLYKEYLDDGRLTKELANYVTDPALTRDAKQEYKAVISRIYLTYNNLAAEYIHEGYFDEAEEYLDIALEMSREYPYIGKKNLTTSKVYMNIAKVQEEKGDIREAIYAIDLAENIQENLFDFEGVYPGLVEVFDLYGDILMKKGDEAEALEKYKEAKELAENSYGLNHPRTGEAYNCLGEYYYTAGEYEEAKECFAQAVEIRRHILGVENALTVRYLYNLSLTDEKLGEVPEAAEVIAEARAVCEKIGLTGELRDHVEEQALALT